MLVAAIAALTALNAAGALTRIDQFGVSHMMPWLKPAAGAKHGSAGLYRPFSWNTNTWSKILDCWTYPCSVLISALILTAVGVVQWRRGRIVAALVPVAAWVVGNGIELIGKHVITRPALYGSAYGRPVHVASFDDSFPSGHMIRGTIVAVAVVFAWRRAERWIAAWALLVGPALIFQSAHTPTDVIGGALVGALLVLVGSEAIRLFEPSASP